MRCGSMNMLWLEPQQLFCDTEFRARRGAGKPAWGDLISWGCWHTHISNQQSLSVLARRMDYKSYY